MSSIEVHNLSGPLCTVTLESNSTVADLKVALAKVLRVPRRQQRLISGSSPLEDCQRLEELGEPRVTFVRITYSAATLEWMALVRRKSAFLSNAPLEVRNDHEVVLTAMQHDRDAICWAAEQILNDRDFAFAVAARHGQALQHLTSWQGDPSIVLAAVSQDPSAIEFASQSLVSQQDFLIDAIQCSKGHVLQHLSPEVQEEVALQKAAVSCNWLMLEHLAQKMPDIRGLPCSGYARLRPLGLGPQNLALEFASVALRRDTELVLLALQRSRGAALRWADETLKGRRLPVGTSVSVVASDLVWENNTGLGLLSPGEQRVRICGLIPPEAVGLPTLTLLGASFLSLSGPYGLVDLSVDESCRVLCHQKPTMSHVTNYVELCSGAGFSSLGFTLAGFVPRCAVEAQPKLAALHKVMHPNVPVITADITDDATAALIHDACPEPATIMAGIACQPYSRAGKQDGGQDARAATLPAAMRLTHWLQAPILVLECVVPARSNEYVLAHLRELETQLRYHVVDCTLKLEDTWSARRYRWWMVATHRRLGRVYIPDYPKGSPLVVRDLMPYTRRWSAFEEEQLMLNALELERFQLGGDPLRKYLVRADQKLPTALHSWGGQTQGCACDCRALGFADVTLQSRGLFAQLLQIPGLGNQIKYRHLHAIEVAIHNGVPPMQAWSSDARLNLCAIGQLASPMHSVWLAASITAHVQKLFTHDTPIDPMQTLGQLKQVVLMQSKEFFPAIPRAGHIALPEQSCSADPGANCQIDVHDGLGVSWKVLHQPSSTIKQLIEAECDLQHMPLYDVQACGVDGIVLSDDLLLREVPVVMLKKPDSSHVSMPVDECMPQVPFTPEDLLPMPDAEPLSPYVPAVAVVATQVDSDVDMSGLEACTPSHGVQSVRVDSLSHEVACDRSVQSLQSLSPASLLAMLPPLVQDVIMCETLRSHRLTWACREQLLLLQEHVWADDEMLWHLQATVANSRKPAVVLDPLLASTWTSTGTVDCVRAWTEAITEPADRIVSAVLMHGHWTPVVWIVKPNCLEVHLHDHDDMDLNGLNGLHGLFCQAFDVSHAAAGHVNRPWCWGAGIDDVHSVLANLLQFHGVPQSATKQRAKLIAQSLGKEQVKRALEGVAPWKSLKQIANQHTPVIQLVLPDELAAVVQDRKARKSNGKEVKTAKPKQVPAKPVDLDPARLQLEPDTFCTQPDTMLQQIPIGHVGPLATGVALVTYADAVPFLQANKVLTNKGLALLLVNGPSDIQTDLQWSSIRFAAKCAVNQQPVLLHGVLVQLGSTPVCPFMRPTNVSVHDVPVACARITVFQDQWPKDWESFSSHPVKEALQHVLPLQTCRVEGCSCDKWHKDPMDHAQDVLLDVFRRQFFTDAGRPVRAHQASHFSVQVRYLKQQEAAVLRCSGNAGLYIEPRLPDSSNPSDEYQVIWLPQSTFAEAQHCMQCEPHSIGLARSGRRYGIRVQSKHFQTMFAKLKPDSQFLAPGERMNWHCGPWPFGSDRKMLAKIFSEMQWQARPLQPALTVEGGIMWLVQSVTEPPQAVWNLQHGPVVVSRCESVSANMLQSSHVIGPQSTVELCSSNAETDPWLTKDPWQGSLKSVPVQSGPCVATQIQEMEERLEKSLLARLPCEQMETDETDNKVQQLELQLQQLATRQQALEGLVSEHHNQHTAQVQTLQSQMMSQMEVQRTQMKGMFDDQMSRLEAILAKKGYMTGDWNYTTDQLAVTSQLLAAGWQEVQTLEFLRSGATPRSTCKGKTQKDHLWLSPELIAAYRGLVITDDQFPDHALLTAKFARDPALYTRYIWPTPCQVNWKQVPDLAVPVDFQQGSPTDQYAAMWKTREDSAQATLQNAWEHNMRGRGQRTSTCTRKGWVAPPKLGRSNDPQPSFMGYDVQHARWLKQLRRLANYHSWAQHHWHEATFASWTHGLLLWRSILDAKGFGASFAGWWTGRNCVGLSDPDVVPSSPPDPCVALSLWECFDGEVRSLERRLSQAKKTARVHAHARDPNLIFRDTRRPLPEPVSSLLVTHRAVIAAVDPDDVAVELEQPCLFDDSRPVLVDDMPVPTIHATDTTLYLGTVQHAKPGMQVTQQTPVGTLDAMFDAFHEQWQKRWCKHDNVPHSHWQNLIAFARASMPQWHMPDLHITPDLLQAEVSHKKPTAATGLDGVSRRDLLAAGPNMLRSCCSMYDRATTDGSWPPQTLTGKVASLAKVPSPTGTGDYRPITVFSLLYRCFSSLQARHMLTLADEWCHADIHGNRKQHQTAHLWKSLVDQIQCAYDQGQCLSGLTADIEKAFNCLPRFPVLAMALHVGTPFSLLQAWTGALASMVRRFKVRDSYSSGFQTSTGLAEGCALSCYGMLLIDDVMHRYVHAQCPAVRVLSFVDNWDFMTWDSTAALKQLDVLLQFADLTDLTVDRAKTFAWSTNAEVRGNMRAAGIPVKHFAKDLGAHVAFSKQRTNQTLAHRLDALSSFWTQLKASKAGYIAKVRALRSVAWPRGLFGVASAPLGHAVWLKHRRLATKSLSFDKPGVNPLLLLGLVEAHADPEWVGIHMTVAEARLLCPLDFWAVELYHAACCLLEPPPSSPTAVLLSRVQRKDFGGLCFVDALHTRRCLRALPPDQQALMRLSLAGGLYTQDAHKHWNDTQGTCKWCGQPDSLEHRYFQCPATASTRASVAPDLVALRHHIPDALALRSWALCPPTQEAWLRCLASIPDELPPCALDFLPDVWNPVFTDGSCLWQSDPAYRVASWGAVLAHPFTPQWTFSCRGVLSSGVLPGLCQSAYRAELYALAVVLHRAAVGGFRVKIYSDCLGVVNKYQLLTRGQARFKVNSANADLWLWVLESTDRLGLDKIYVLKTPAHRTVASARSRFEAWMFWHNAAADQVAKFANLDRGEAFWKVWSDHSEAVVAARQLHQQAWNLHLAVAQQSVKDENAMTLDSLPAQQPKPTRVFQTKFDIGAWQGEVPSQLAHEYGFGMAQRIAIWWKARTGTGDSTVQWVSCAHLYIDYQLSWGCAGPLKCKSAWLDTFLRPYVDGNKFPFLKRLKWFRRCLKLFLAQTRQTVGLEICRCISEIVQAHVFAASVAWDAAALATTESWLATNCSGPVARGTKMLQALPLAKVSKGMCLAELASKDAAFSADCT
ncbi:unnamed protein product [Cladocopium goreaui]|uniref:Conserved oligomeric Golgi complex subunit 2 (Component of oligomeric Golgi complex 2) n=1 Tax=Cladocopium goreaui TaxID=2562237 RepID=A0A9P1GTL6_9DINO|nr:unnamed protein product [Cladocopium goreaui]